MPSGATHCLFDDWQRTSAPVLHMSEFWPTFDEAGIHHFLSTRQGEPVSAAAINQAAAQAATERIQTFVAAATGSSAPCRDQYLAFEQERLATLQLITEPPDPARINALNDELYGSLDELGAPAALAFLLHRVAATEPKSPAAAAAREHVLATWPDVTPSDTLGAKFAEIERYRQALAPYVKRRYGFIHDYTAAPGQTLPSQAVADILGRALTEILGPGSDGWSAIVENGAPNVFIGYQQRAVVIPAGRNYAIDHLHTLIVHEIGVHIIRSVNGEHSREPLAAFGLAGYGPIEEALGVLLGNAGLPHHQKINSLVPFAVIDYAARQPAPSFRDVHTLTTALITCLANPSPDKYEANHYQYARTAFSRTLRVLRLGNNQLIERSTTKYWRGFLQLCNYFAAHPPTTPNLDTLFAGKYDPNSAAQLELITHHK